MIGSWFLYGATAWCFLIGVWRHDWILILASIALMIVWGLIGREAQNI